MLEPGNSHVMVKEDINKIFNAYVHAQHTKKQCVKQPHLTQCFHLSTKRIFLEGFTDCVISETLLINFCTSFWTPLPSGQGPISLVL